MTQPRTIKYTFDTVFGEPGATLGSAPLRKRSSFSADEVEAIRLRTFAEGKADSEAQAAAQRSAALAAIAQGIGRMVGEIDKTVLRLRHESAEAALGVGRKLAETALAAFPLKEVEGVVTDCLHKLHREPRLVARVPATLADQLRGDIDDLCKQHGFAGRVIILGEDALKGSDCRVEWADGGVERSLDETFAAIEQAAERWRISTPTDEQ